MDKLILDFEGEKIEISSGFAYERCVSQIGMKIKHNGILWKVFDRQIEGVDEPEGDGLTLVIMLEKA